MPIVYRSRSWFSESAERTNGRWFAEDIMRLEEDLSGMTVSFLLESAARVGTISGMTVSPGTNFIQMVAVRSAIASDKILSRRTFEENQWPNQSLEATAINSPPFNQSQGLAVPHL